MKSALCPDIRPIEYLTVPVTLIERKAMLGMRKHIWRCNEPPKLYAVASYILRVMLAHPNVIIDASNAFAKYRDSEGFKAGAESLFIARIAQSREYAELTRKL